MTVCNTGGSISECGRYFEILSEKQVDGIVLIGSVFNELIHYPEMTARIKGIPVVVANGQVKQPDFYSVMVDDMKGIRSVVDYLYEKGHRTCSISMTWRRKAAGRNVRDFWRP